MSRIPFIDAIADDSGLPTRVVHHRLVLGTHDNRSALDDETDVRRIPQVAQRASRRLGGCSRFEGSPGTNDVEHLLYCRHAGLVHESEFVGVGSREWDRTFPRCSGWHWLDEPRQVVRRDARPSVSRRATIHRILPAAAADHVVGEVSSTWCVAELHRCLPPAPLTWPAPSGCAVTCRSRPCAASKYTATTIAWWAPPSTLIVVAPRCLRALAASSAPAIFLTVPPWSSLRPEGTRRGRAEHGTEPPG